MQSAEFYHRQADLCIQLSRACSDKKVSARLLILAEKYRAIAEEIAEIRPQYLTTVIILDKPRPEK